MKQMFFLGLGMFTIGCDSFVIPGLLLGIGKSLGISAAATGQGITFFDLAYVISAPLFAILLAKKLARPVLIVALILFILGNLLTLFSSNVIVYWMSRALVGMGTGLYIPVVVVAATKLVGVDARGRALSFIWGVNSAGAVLGVPFSLWLADSIGWRAAICFILVLGVAGLIGIGGLQQNLGMTATSSTQKERIHWIFELPILSVVGITFITATGSLGLYTYVALLQSETTHSITMVLCLWNLGGFMGSTGIGYFVDRVKQAQWVMGGVLFILILSILLIPTLDSIPILSLLPYFAWGAAGWATVIPQQHVLMEMKPEQGETLTALNSSAVCLGSAMGSALGGLAIARGMSAKNLPYAAIGILLIALFWQLFLFKNLKHEVLQHDSSSQ